MSTKLSASVYRLACNQANRDNASDVLRGTSQPIIIWRNSSAMIQGAMFLADPSQAANLVTDLSNITSVILALRAGGPIGALLIPEQTIAAGNLNAGLTYAAWTALTAQHFQFALTPDLTNVAAQSKVWLVIAVTTTDAGTFPIAISSNVEFRDPGVGNPGDPNPTLPYTGWSKAEADTRYLLAANRAFDATITSVGDGAAHSLETIATATLVPPVLRTVYVGGELQDWLLLTGTDANDALHRRPNDYADPANAKVWVRQR